MSQLNVFKFKLRPGAPAFAPLTGNNAADAKEQTTLVSCKQDAKKPSAKSSSNVFKSDPNLWFCTHFVTPEEYPPFMWKQNNSKSNYYNSENYAKTHLQLSYVELFILDQARIRLSDRDDDTDIAKEILSIIKSKYKTNMHYLIPEPRALYFLVRGLYKNAKWETNLKLGLTDFQNAENVAKNIEDSCTKKLLLEQICEGRIDSQVRFAKRLMEETINNKVEYYTVALVILKSLPEGTPGVPELINQANAFISKNQQGHTVQPNDQTKITCSI